jgi:hypothetical protein
VKGILPLTTKHADILVKYFDPRFLVFLYAWHFLSRGKEPSPCAWKACSIFESKARR